MAIKIGIGGPPQSGKSVLNKVLASLLPLSQVARIEGAPDGEGSTGWYHSAHDDLRPVIRKKGSFYKEDESGEIVDFASEVARRVQRSSHPIVIVDVGGMMLTDNGELAKDGRHLTTENEKILRACDYFIVISSKPDLAKNWLEETGRLGLKTLAVLDSDLYGQDEVFSIEDPIQARISGLDRDNPPYGSTVARAVANRILELAGTGAADSSEERADINFEALAQSLDLPFMNSGPNRDWVPSCLPELVSSVHSLIEGREEVRLWGCCSAGFPYHALACGLKQRVRYYDAGISAYIPLPELQVSGHGNHFLNWQIEERDGHTLVEFVIPGQIFDVFDLPMVIVPAVQLDKGVVVSGKAPWWLTGAIARAYHRAGVRWTAVFTPQESSRPSANGRTWYDNHSDYGPAVVVASRDPQVPLGMVVPFQLLEK